MIGAADWSCATGFPFPAVARSPCAERFGLGLARCCVVDVATLTVGVSLGFGVGVGFGFGFAGNVEKGPS